MQNFNRQSGVWFLAPIVAALTAVIGAITTFATTMIGALAAVFVLRGAVVAVYLLTIVALYSGIEACLTFMRNNSPSVPSEVSTAASWVLPSNTATFLECLMTIAFLEFAFRHKNYIAGVLGGAR